MKIKLSFVSNSSSTSFIVIKKDNLKTWLPCLENNVLVVDSSFGTTEFGWGPAVIDDIESKIIFSYLQTLYSENNEHKQLLDNLLKDYGNIDRIIWKIKNDHNSDYDYPHVGYIDHESQYPNNSQMFLNKEALRDFIFGKNSYIYLDNDNY